ncbi:uncharacterized protein LOC141673110 [Apium graveolens]|uniref:uncharacterized protein LOC141673110 n=1 Tax=Apium graveolens TaxID=4045 RepID=UPI003D79A59D
MKNPVGELLDTGNLVPRDEDHDLSNIEDFRWQSLDHPENNLLPAGMKFGIETFINIDSNDEELEKKIELLTEKGIWFAQHGVYLNSLTASERQRIYDIWSGVKTWNADYDYDDNELDIGFVKQNFRFFIQEYGKHGLELDLNVQHYLELSLYLYNNNCDEIMHILKNLDLFSDKTGSNFALKLVDEGNDKAVDVANYVSTAGFERFWRSASQTCPVPSAVHVRCTKKVGHGDKKLCVVQEIKYTVPYSNLRGNGTENTYYTCFSEPEADHTNTNPDHNVMLLVNAEDRKILNRHTKELGGRAAQARESTSNGSFTISMENLLKFGTKNKRKNKNKA